jgi:hypothetical protein
MLRMKENQKIASVEDAKLDGWFLGMIAHASWAQGLCFDMDCSSVFTRW